MNFIYKTKIIALFLPLTLGLFAAVSVRAATDNVSFDPTSGNLVVSGSCSSKFVLVVIRRTSDNSIWGSSNPQCNNGSYTFSVPVQPTDRTGGVFAIQVGDSASADGQLATSSAQGLQNVTFSAPAVQSAPPPGPPTPTITLDTSSIATVPGDQSFVDKAVSDFFGVIVDAANAAQSFTTAVFGTIQASVAAVTNLFVKSVAILPGGSLTVPRGADQVAGSNWLNAGASSVFIPATAVTSSSQVIVTPTSITDLPLIVTDKTDGVGFTVDTVTPVGQSVSFDWLIVNTYDASAPAQSENIQQSAGNGSQTADMASQVVGSNTSSSQSSTSSSMPGAASNASTSVITNTSSTTQSVLPSSTSSTNTATSSTPADLPIDAGTSTPASGTSSSGTSAAAPSSSPASSSSTSQ